MAEKVTESNVINFAQKRLEHENAKLMEEIKKVDNRMHLLTVYGVVIP